MSPVPQYSVLGSASSLSMAMKFELSAVTLCHARDPIGSGYNILIAQALCQIQGALLNPLVRFPG